MLLKFSRKKLTKLASPTLTPKNLIILKLRCSSTINLKVILKRVITICFFLYFCFFFFSLKFFKTLKKMGALWILWSTSTNHIQFSHLSFYLQLIFFLFKWRETRDKIVKSTNRFEKIFFWKFVSISTSLSVLVFINCFFVANNNNNKS